METQYLRTLLVAAQEGSFSKAAVQLNVTQSAVSQRTKSLESCCGVALLDRSGGTLQPTEAGQVVLESAQRILQMEEQMMRELRSLTDRKHLYICCTPAFGVAHLPQIIRSFTEAQRDIDDLMFLFDSPVQALAGLRAGEFDVAVIEHLPDIDFGGMRHMDLPKDEMVFVSAPQLGIDEVHTSLTNLQQHCFIMRRAGCSCRDLFSLNLVNSASDINAFRQVMVLDEFNLIITEVLAGAGITFISRSVVAKYLDQGLLREHKVDGFNHYRCRSIVALSCESPTSLKRMFLETVLRYFDIEMLV